ncbi:hypothetical protein KIN20_018617 [Parelaphostrongylus tenuis]|uniref:Uncharacterized protein n=1 Tax=Parelaphostrongylus tenuis TaxID=148309 RepID=A0AAD5MNA2_PARTN|nr:hypothetical protein KIN20_018617 [Parelaphostrongylus tenuis]
MELDGKFREFSDETFRTLTHYRTKSFQSNFTELQKRGMKEFVKNDVLWFMRSLAD